MACIWVVRVPSGNPEPDCEADLWREVECGHPTVSVERYNPMRGEVETVDAYCEGHVEPATMDLLEFEMAVEAGTSWS